MDTSKIIKGVVNSGRYTVTAPIIKEDYGLYLQIEGVELPQTYEVDFSNSEHSGTSVTMIGNADGVLIPRQFIDSGKDVFAFLYHVGENYGKTVYKFRIPNKLRPDRTNEEPTPEEQSTIDQLIGALNSAVEQTGEDVESAEQAKDDAESARDNAQTYANNAQSSAQASARSAESASQSASQASQSATASAQSASASAQIKSDIENMVDDAQSYAESALIASQASVTARDTAQGHALSASASAQSASGYASNAQTSANTASSKATEASTSAQTASAKATEASQSASQASGYAQTAESAKTDAQTAQGKAEDAQTAAETAQGKAEDAQEAAERVAESIPSDYSQLSGDVSDLKEDLTATNAEVTDIRVGADGTTYNSAGAAVRGQINDISERNKNLIDGYLPYAISLSDNTVIYGFGASAGTTLYFKCEAGKTYTFSSSSSAINRHLLAYFSEMPELRDSTEYYSGSIVDANLVTFTAPISGYCLYYVKNAVDTSIIGTSQFEEGSTATGYVAPAITAVDDVARGIAESASDAVESLSTKIINYNIPINIVGSCVLYSNGTILTGQGDEYRRSDYIDITKYKRIESLQHGNGVIATVAFYDTDKTYLSDISLNTASLKTINIDLTSPAYSSAKYLIVSVSGWSTYGANVYATLIANYDVSELNKLKNPKGYTNLLSIGDSLTNATGGGVSGGKRWQDVILDAFGMTSFITSGAIGLTVAQYGDNSIYSAVQALTADASVNLISFWGGTNDFANNIVIGDFDTQINSETRDVTTFYGGLIACVEKILTLYPTKRFFLVGTTPRVFNASTMADHHTVTNTLGLYLSDYVDAVKKVANYFAIPFVNLLEVSGINKYNISTYLYIQTSGSTSYYLHLSDAGETLIGNILASFVRSIG